MKEFEKWLNEQTLILNPSQQSKDIMCLTWKAALWWVAKRGMYHYGNDFLTDMNELSTEIQIELGMLDERGKVVQ